MKQGTWTRYHTLAVSLCLAAFVAAGLVSALILEQVPHLEDEVAYLFQAQVFAAGDLYAEEPSYSACFFAPFVVDYQGRRFGKYTPGWPALLAVGVWLGQPWWVNAAGAALTLALIFCLGRELHGLRAGTLAAALATTSPFVLFLSGSFMSHTWCLVFVTGFLWCFYRACRGGAHRTDWAVAAGVLLGAAFTIRPFTAVAIAIPAGIYALWRLVRFREWRLPWLVGVGWAPLALAVPLFNAIWTGDPLLSPYVLFWPYDRLGFGPGTGPLPTGNTIWLGLSSAVVAVGNLANHLLGWPALSLSFVLLFFLFKPRRRRDLFLAATVISLILAYVFYWTNGDVFGPRYAYETASALFILSGAGIVRVADWARKRNKLSLVYVALGLLIVVNLALYLPVQVRRYKGLYGITAAPRQVFQEADLHHALVIVHEERGWWDYAVAFSMNTPALDGSVVYARDCGVYNGELMDHFSGRSVYYFDGDRLWPYASARSVQKP